MASPGFVAPPLRPEAPERPGADGPPGMQTAKPATQAAPSGPCLDAPGIASMMESLQVRVLSAEKRTALMEQRLVSALDECQSRRPPAQTGCTWSLFALTVAAFLAVLFFLRRGGSSAPAAGSASLAQPSLPSFVVPAGSLPGSPQMVLPLGHAPPPTFVSAPVA